MSPLAAREPVVRRSTPMPKGYVFVPKGNVYVTGNCRKRTQEAGEDVYAVVDRNKRTVGIRVPRAVFEEVLASEASSRRDRASAVQKRDNALERNFREAVKRLFPKAPDGEIPKVVRRAMQKGSGRVGRTSTIDIEQKATLAVRAHIRHVHTDYDKLLKKGTKRDTARKETMTSVDETLKAWGGNPVDASNIKKDRKSITKTDDANGKAMKEARLVQKAEKHIQSLLARGGLQTERPTDEPVNVIPAKKMSSKPESIAAKRAARRAAKRARKRANKEAAKDAQIKKSGQNLGNSLSSVAQSPKERRERKLRMRRTRDTSMVASPLETFESGAVGRSLRDDLSDIEESDEYVDTTDTDEWSGTDEEYLD